MKREREKVHVSFPHDGPPSLPRSLWPPPLHRPSPPSRGPPSALSPSFLLQLITPYTSRISTTSPVSLVSPCRALLPCLPSLSCGLLRCTGASSSSATSALSVRRITFSSETNSSELSGPIQPREAPSPSSPLRSARRRSPSSVDCSGTPSTLPRPLSTFCAPLSSSHWVFPRQQGNGDGNGRGGMGPLRQKGGRGADVEGNHEPLTDSPKSLDSLINTRERRGGGGEESSGESSGEMSVRIAVTHRLCHCRRCTC